MKVYQDLVIRGSQTTLDGFIANIEQRLTDGWTRHHTRESEVRKAALGRMYCFSRTASDVRLASQLWMATRSDGALYVSNILAQERLSLTHDQYNAILREFHDRFAYPAAQAAGAKVELGNPDPQIEDVLSAHTAKLLRTFSSGANRSVLHPLDRKRWNEFLTAAYREAAPLTTSTLQQWLIEEERWPEDGAIDLAIEYERARDLLAVYASRSA